MKDLVTIILLVAAIISLAANQFLSSSKKIVLDDVRETRTFTTFLQSNPHMDILKIKQDSKNLFTIEYVDRNTRVLKKRKFRMSGVHMFPLDVEEL
jgi:hypothetical protein